MGFLGNLQAEKYDRQYDDRYLLRRVLSYFEPHRRQLYVIVAAVVVFSLLTTALTILISVGVGLLGSAGNDVALLALIGALFATAFILYFIYWVRRRLTVRVIAAIVSSIRKDAFKAAVHRDLAFYDDTKSGKIVSRITSDTQELNQIALLITDIVSDLLTVVLLLVVLFSQDWQLTLVVLLLAPMIIGAALIFRHFARIVTRQGSRAMAEVNDNIQESVSGISVAKNFRREAMIYDEFVDINLQSYRINLKRGFVLALVFPTLNVLAGFAIGAVLYAGGNTVVAGAINIGTWYLFLQSVDRFWFPFINLSSFWSQLQQGLSAVERIFALIDADNTVVQTDNQIVGEVHGKIEFKNVTFMYQPEKMLEVDPKTNGNRPTTDEDGVEQSLYVYKPGSAVLENFNLTIAPGESIAFVGHTGAGKSTIARLITRFYEFQFGQILIDDRDIRSFDMLDYRRHLGIVPQQPFLFSGTIMDNIRYARPEAPDDEIEAVAHSIGGGEWLETMPNGLHSDVGERGAHLSMGQRQLVSLLRVLVQRPSIFILDEATASIDPFTEMQIQEALDLILQQSTSILIAHRLSTVRSADRIIVLKQGDIIEQGNHTQLMAQDGHYAELYNTYFRHQSLDYVENSRALLAGEAGAD